MTGPSTPEGGEVLGEKVRQEIGSAFVAAGWPSRANLPQLLTAMEPIVAALVAKARAEEREKIAVALDDEAQRWRELPPVQSDAAVVAVGRDASIRATEYAARVARGTS